VFARRREADFFVCWFPVVGIGGGLGWRAPNSVKILRYLQQMDRSVFEEKAEATLSALRRRKKRSFRV
jgi:hypothetical protein